MVQETFNVYMDETLKEQFESLCSDLGMTESTAISVFARALVRERNLSFEFTVSEDEIIMENGRQAFWAIREQAKKNFPNGMTLEEINEEIRKVRYGEDDEE